MDDKKLDDLWRWQAEYLASRQRIMKAQKALAAYRCRAVRDPSREAVLLGAYQEALDDLLEIGERASLFQFSQSIPTAF